MLTELPDPILLNRVNKRNGRINQTQSLSRSVIYMANFNVRNYLYSRQPQRQAHRHFPTNNFWNHTPKLVPYNMNAAGKGK